MRVPRALKRSFFIFTPILLLFTFLMIHRRGASSLMLQETDVDYVGIEFINSTSDCTAAQRQATILSHRLSRLMKHNERITKDRLALIQKAKKTESLLQELEQLKTLKDYDEKIMDRIPSGSAWCYNNPNSRFQNICFDPAKDVFFVVSTNLSTFRGIDAQGRVMSNSNGGFITINYTPASTYKHAKVNMFYDPHVFVHRHTFNNLLRYLHDDVLGLFDLIREAGTPQTRKLLFVDNEWDNRFARPFEYLGKISYKAGLKMRTDVISCYESAIVGQTNSLKWYKFPGSPLKGKKINSDRVRDIINFYLRKQEIPVDPIDGYEVTLVKDWNRKEYAVILAEYSDRQVITNRIKLSQALLEKTGLEGAIVYADQYTFEDQVKILRHAKVVIGVHSHILGMALFCRPKTIIIEVFPYALRKEHYTAIKRMAEIMDLKYVAYENHDPTKTKAHPERVRIFGGIQHLPVKKQQEIEETRWVGDWDEFDENSEARLYREWQDTELDIPEFVGIVKKSLMGLNE